MDRKTDSYQTTGSTASTTANSWVLIARNIYNETRKLKTKMMHSTNSGGIFAEITGLYVQSERLDEWINHNVLKEDFKLAKRVSKMVFPGWPSVVIPLSNMGHNICNIFAVL